MELCNPTELKTLLAKHGFSFSKGLGQNFLINPSVCPRMAEECGAAANDGVLEIGPGVGVLTKELAKRAKKVVAVELDRRLLPLLDETLAEYPNAEVVCGDAMKLDLAKLIAEKFADCARVFVCANLPYYITSPVIMRLLEERLPLTAVTVMVQKEAAERLCAAVGSREAGAVTVAVTHFADAEVLFPVGRSSFMPSPKVDSAVIRLTLTHPKQDAAAEKLFFSAVRAGFNQRRKTLINALSACGMKKEAVSASLAAASLPVSVRAEALTMSEWQDFIVELAKNNGFTAANVD